MYHCRGLKYNDHFRIIFISNVDNIFGHSGAGKIDHLVRTYAGVRADTWKNSPTGNLNELDESSCWAIDNATIPSSTRMENIVARACVGRAGLGCARCKMLDGVLCVCPGLSIQKMKNALIRSCLNVL